MKDEILLNDLLPCPFCGEKPIVVIEDNEGNVHSDEDYEDNPYFGRRM